MRLLEWIDVREGIYAGLLMGSAVAWINLDHGLLPASVAGIKQAVYTFFFGGAVLRLCTQIASMRGADAVAVVAAVALPSLLTTTAIFFVHNLRGTPEPLLSCLPVVVTSPPGFALWAWRARRAQRGSPEP